MIEFDPATHSYLLDGKPVPSVTKILADTGFIDATWFTEWACRRGTLAHLCTHLDDTNELDEDTVDPELVPYLAAYRRFKVESGFIVLGSEVRMASVTHRFAGTLDKVGTFGNAAAIIDLETGSHQPVKAIQTAGYELLRGSPHKRFALQLKDDGSYKIHPFTDRQDKQIFMSALAVYHWKNNNLRGRG
jgi:hypothetical protein